MKAAETSEERALRYRRREQFDEIASRYESYRPRHPVSLVDALLAATGLSAGSTVLEIGCGTGQLTDVLCARRLDVTAIDVSESMVDVARRRLGGRGVRFEVQSFEALAAEPRSLDLVVSADAFHWVDPEVRYEKAAVVLAPGGWLAVIGCEECYEEPLRTAVQTMWVARSDDGGAWLHAPKPTVADEMMASRRFGPAVELVHEWPMTLSPQQVVGLEATRATALCWDSATRQAFSEELAERIGPVPSVQLVRRAYLALAPSVAGGSAP